MADYHVTKQGDQRVSKREGAERASLWHDPRANAIAASRRYLGNHGGGELNVQGVDGRIRAKDNIAPGDDPRNVKG